MNPFESSSYGFTVIHLLRKLENCVIQTIIYAPPATGKTTLRHELQDYFTVFDTDEINFATQLPTHFDYLLTNRHEILTWLSNSHIVFFLPDENTFLERCTLRRLAPQPTWYNDVVLASLRAHTLFRTNYYLTETEYFRRIYRIVHAEEGQE